MQWLNLQDHYQSCCIIHDSMMFTASKQLHAYNKEGKQCWVECLFSTQALQSLQNSRTSGRMHAHSAPSNFFVLLALHCPVLPQVLELLSHINKRVKALPGCSLPLLPLLQLAVGGSSSSSAPASPMVASFALVYVEMGQPRAPAEEQLQAVSRVGAGLVVGYGVCRI
jgi:hypothetical protein